MGYAIAFFGGFLSFPALFTLYVIFFCEDISDR